jgi:two-component system OmpR family sensor kinase
MSRLSLRLRLTLVFALAMALLLAATGLFLYIRLRSTLDEQIDQALRARADDVAALVGRTGAGLGDGNRRLAESEESFAQVLARDGAVRDATPPLGTTPLLTSDQLVQARSRTLFVERGPVPGLEETRVRMLATPTAAEGGTVIVVAGASLEDRDEALAGLRSQLLVGGPLALLLASLAGYVLAAAALRPVEAMRRRAEEISATTAGRRLPVPAADDEVARLARTLNEMLARLDAGLERERRFVAEASHELRTPLSLLKTELELALRRPRSAEELRAAIASAAEETDRLALLADALLTLARSDEGELRLDAEQVAVPELLETVAHRFSPRARESGRALEVDAPPGLAIVGDRLRLEQALGNLVDNALRYGAGTVRLEAVPENGALGLRVSDEGAGFPAAFLPRAYERFSRADESRTGARRRNRARARRERLRREPRRRRRRGHARPSDSSRSHLEPLASRRHGYARLRPGSDRCTRHGRRLRIGRLGVAADRE